MDHNQQYNNYSGIQSRTHANQIQLQKADRKNTQQFKKGVTRPDFELIGDNSTLGMLSPKSPKETRAE